MGELYTSTKMMHKVVVLLALAVSCNALVTSVGLISGYRGAPIRDSLAPRPYPSFYSAPVSGFSGEGVSGRAYKYIASSYAADSDGYVVYGGANGRPIVGFDNHGQPLSDGSATGYVSPRHY